MCVCVRERERERVSVCVCVYVLREEREGRELGELKRKGRWCCANFYAQSEFLPPFSRKLTL